MKLTIENTDRVVELETPGGTVPARVWEGETETGVPVICLVTRVVVQDDGGAEVARWLAELGDARPPSPVAQAIPLRLVL